MTKTLLVAAAILSLSWSAGTGGSRILDGYAVPGCRPTKLLGADPSAFLRDGAFHQ
jgi:hypothetical protein